MSTTYTLAGGVINKESISAHHGGGAQEISSAGIKALEWKRSENGALVK